MRQRRILRHAKPHDLPFFLVGSFVGRNSPDRFIEGDEYSLAITHTYGDLRTLPSVALEPEFAELVGLGSGESLAPIQEEDWHFSDSLAGAYRIHHLASEQNLARVGAWGPSEKEVPAPLDRWGDVVKCVVILGE